MDNFVNSRGSHFLKWLSAPTVKHLRNWSFSSSILTISKSVFCFCVSGQWIFVEHYFTNAPVHFISRVPLNMGFGLVHRRYHMGLDFQATRSPFGWPASIAYFSALAVKFRTINCLPITTWEAQLSFRLRVRRDIGSCHSEQALCSWA